MLLSQSFKPVTSIPHKAEFDVWKNRLTEQEYEDLISVLTDKINENEINTSSWIPGADWRGTFSNHL